MKELAGWRVWVWRGWETWQRMFVLGAVFLGAGASASDSLRPYLLAVPIVIVFGYSFKWMVWDGIKSSWAKYKDHRNQLLTTIKTSDQ